MKIGFFLNAYLHYEKKTFFGEIGGILMDMLPSQTPWRLKVFRVMLDFLRRKIYQLKPHGVLCAAIRQKGYGLSFANLPRLFSGSWLYLAPVNILLHHKVGWIVGTLLQIVPSLGLRLSWWWAAPNSPPAEYFRVYRVRLVAPFCAAQLFAIF